MRSFERIFLDFSERFLAADGLEEAWKIAEQITLEIGGNALNAAGTMQSGKSVEWARSTMTETWLDTYQGHGFHTVDPLLIGLIGDEVEMRTQTGVLTRQDASSFSAYELNNSLKSHSYGSFYSSVFGHAGGGEKILIVHCNEMDLEHVDRAFGFGGLRAINSLIAAHIRRPKWTRGSGFLKLSNQALTTRERDILCWLACGLRNDEIAHKAGIAEVTVRKHLISIRRKLSADTREHAIAIAIRDGWIRP